MDDETDEQQALRIADEQGIPVTVARMRVLRARQEREREAQESQR